PSMQRNAVKWTSTTILGWTLVVASSSTARADQDEASAHVQLVGGLARLGDDASTNPPATAPLLGLEGRASYAFSDWYQLDTALTVAGSGSAHFDFGTFDPPGPPPKVMGAFRVTQQLVRLDVGATLRLGVRFIPTLRVAIGAEGRRVSSPSGFGADVRDAQLD